MNEEKIIKDMRIKRVRSIPYLQCKLKISYLRAKKICDLLVFDKKENIYLKRMEEYLSSRNNMNTTRLT
jgi:hypothetical protein